MTLSTKDDEVEEEESEVPPPTALCDQDLVSRIKAGDGTAFDELVRIYLPITFRRVRMLVPVDDAEDVVQDIMLNLVGSIDKFKGRSTFATWFYRIVANKVADYHRRMSRIRGRVVHAEDLEGHEPVQDPDYSFEVMDFLMSLPKHYREVIMGKMDDMSFAEIAADIGLSYEAARSRYRRGIKYAACKLDSKLLRKP